MRRWHGKADWQDEDADDQNALADDSLKGTGIRGHKQMTRESTRKRLPTLQGQHRLPFDLGNAPNKRRRLGESSQAEDKEDGQDFNHGGEEDEGCSQDETNEEAGSGKEGVYEEEDQSEEAPNNEAEPERESSVASTQPSSPEEEDTIDLPKPPPLLAAPITQSDAKSASKAKESGFSKKHITISWDQTKLSGYERATLLSILKRNVQCAQTEEPGPLSQAAGSNNQPGIIDFLTPFTVDHKSAIVDPLEALGTSVVRPLPNASLLPSGKIKEPSRPDPATRMSIQLQEDLQDSIKASLQAEEHLIINQNSPVDNSELAQHTANTTQMPDVSLAEAVPYTSNLVEELRHRVSVLERENSDLRKGQPAVQFTYQVLHVIEDNKTATVCLEKPTWTFNRQDRLELKPENPLLDPMLYLDRMSDLAFVVYKYYSSPLRAKADIRDILETDAMPDPVHSRETIVLRFTELQQALDEFISLQSHSEVEFQRFSSTEPLHAPYLFWFRYARNRHEVEQLEPVRRDLLKLLTDWIDANYKSKYIQIEHQFSQGRVSQETMPYLFRLGEVIIGNDGENLRGYILTEKKEAGGGRSHRENQFQKLLGPVLKDPWRWSIRLWSLGYDGDFYKDTTLIDLELSANHVDDEIGICKLKVFPLRFAPEGTSGQLKKRGSIFWSCRVKRFVAYQGRVDDTFNTEGERYMVDFASYKQLHADSVKKASRSFSVNAERMPPDFADQTHPPTDSMLYIFPPTINGYNLRRKRWLDLDVGRISDVVWNKNAFDHLVADDETKELVQALVAERLESERSTDIISGKGNGLIMLLHGGPGTGKTFTAESVAEMAEKPLYSVTCGDIGTQPEEVEQYLESVLHLGKVWDCVVLLDEADVFLEERSLQDLQRNALVSVFLRALEYYDGILILTSNRVATFDEAFKSRIQLALHYKPLKKGHRLKVWKNFINRLRDIKEPNIDFDDIECNLHELADEEMNGRQIRNILTVGRQLARFQNKSGQKTGDLAFRHLKHVIKVAGQFDNYLKGTKDGMTGDQLAMASGVR